MLDVLNLALPFFGLIFLGLICGKLKLGIPETGLAWMGFFLIYLALPCLFYRVLALTPLEELSNPGFIAGTVLATATAFAFGIGWAFRRNVAEATIAGLSGSYGNIGYMGAGLALATLGSAANVPVALIFCFDTSTFSPCHNHYNSLNLDKNLHLFQKRSMVSMLGSGSRWWCKTHRMPSWLSGPRPQIAPTISDAAMGYARTDRACAGGQEGAGQNDLPRTGVRCRAHGEGPR